MSVKITTNEVPPTPQYLTYEDLKPGVPYFSANVSGFVYVKPNESFIKSQNNVLLFMNIRDNKLNVMTRIMGREFYPAVGYTITINGE